MSNHHHITTAGKYQRRLATVLVITLTILAVEVVGAISTGSLALLADAGHMAADAGGIGLALFAIWIAQRPTTDERSFGHYRAEILAAVVNAVVLLGVGGYIVYEAISRLINPEEVHSSLMAVFAGIAVVGNCVSLLLLRQGQSESLNLRGAFLEVLADMLGALFVIIAALLIYFTDYLRFDAIASLAIAILIVPRTWRLLRDAVDVLLEATPKHIDIADIRRHMLETPGVIDIHDVHVWTITSGMPVISAHVVVEDVANNGATLDTLGACLADHFDIEHSTFQLEPAEHSQHENHLHT